MSRKHLSDKILANGTTTTSLGTSSSANITVASSGHVGVEDHSLLPNLKPDKGWYSKTDSTIDLDADRK